MPVWVVTFPITILKFALMIVAFLHVTVTYHFWRQLDCNLSKSCLKYIKHLHKRQTKILISYKAQFKAQTVNVQRWCHSLHDALACTNNEPGEKQQQQQQQQHTQTKQKKQVPHFHRREVKTRKRSYQNPYGFYTRFWTEYPWCNPLFLAGLEAPTN